MTRRARWAGAVALSLALAATACSGDDGATTAVTTTSVVTTDLAAAVPEPPAGFQPIPERSRDFDLDQYATGLSLAPDGDRAALTAAGFRRGLLRAWTATEGGVAVALYVFELADGKGAAAVQEHFVVDGRALLQTTPFEVTGVPGAQGASYAGGTPEAPTRVHAVYLTSGPMFLNLIASHADAAASPDTAIAFARRAVAVTPPRGRG